MKHLIAFGSGVVFAMGLVLGGMTRPAKILAFLDVTGRWDPGLALVMAGALVVHGGAIRLLGRQRSVSLREPMFAGVDARLIAGAGVFGVGWGLSGYCPGPALTSLCAGSVPAVVASCMVMGIGLHDILVDVPQRRREKRRVERASTPAGA
jgi:hypothetical protein